MEFFEENRTAILILGLTVVLGKTIVKGVRPLVKQAIKGYIAARDQVAGSSAS